MTASTSTRPAASRTDIARGTTGDTAAKAAATSASGVSRPMRWRAGTAGAAAFCCGIPLMAATLTWAATKCPVSA